ncbi:MAG TPA: lysophospholipid acyltransferase family protein [Rhodothermales bacterium]|nr:lysophospholipid acyltransferase family protein [Rhodothermales bacterium]HRR07719.1 lysophospholipid acyltransferase family protein [Rhodothermales bacterium]
MLYFLAIQRILRLVISLIARTAWLSLRLKFHPPSKRRRIAYEEISHTARRLCNILNIEVRLQNQPPEADRGLVVSNHLGYIDMLVLASVWPVCFVARHTLEREFLFGWIAGTFQTIFVNRERKTATENFVREVRGRLNEGYRVLVFPEGRATLGDTVYPFKTGAFEAVAQTSLPIIPIYMGLHEIDGVKPFGQIRWKICWHAPMPIFRHIWRLLSIRKTVFEVTFAESFSAYNHTRKTASLAAHQQILTQFEAHHHMLEAPEWAINRTGTPPIKLTDLP